MDSRLPADHWQVIIVRHGTRATLRSESFLNYSSYGEPDSPHTVDYFFWVLRRRDEVVVVDTGFSEQGASSRGREVLIDPIEALERLGITVDSAPPVVLTHGHYDHAGNISAFTHSRIIMSRGEFEFWTGDVASRHLFAHLAEATEIEALRRADHEGRLELFSIEREVASGVRLLEVGGHTPGQVMVEVQTSAGVVLLTSDAVHFHEELEQDMPFSSMADVPQSYRVLAEVRASAAAHIVTGHDAKTLSAHPPLGAPLEGLAAIIGD